VYSSITEWRRSIAYSVSGPTPAASAHCQANWGWGVLTSGGPIPPKPPPPRGPAGTMKLAASRPAEVIMTAAVPHPPGGTVPDRRITAGRLRNLRDAGGYRTADGREVGRGLLFRSDSLTKLTLVEWSELRAQLGLRAVLDLRYPEEIAVKGRVPHTAGLAYLNASIQHRPYDQTVLTADTDPGGYLADRYAETALDGTSELLQALQFIADAGSTPLACAFHLGPRPDHDRKRKSAF